MDNLEIVKEAASTITGALSKLTDVVLFIWGAKNRPEQIRKEADAEAYKVEVIEGAKARAAANSREIEFESNERIRNRVLNQEKKREENLQTILADTKAQLESENSISDEPVNEDWVTRFFNNAQDVSDEDMQKLWARVLSGEIKKPNSYSLRTLEFLKNLTKDEAKIFNKLSDYVISSELGYFVVDASKQMDDYKVSFSDVLLLRELGLLQNEPNLTMTIRLKESVVLLKYQHKGLVVSSRNLLSQTDTFSISPTPKENSTSEVEAATLLVFKLTKTAQELYQLTNPSLDFSYLKTIKKIINEQRAKVMLTDVKTESKGVTAYNFIDI